MIRVKQWQEFSRLVEEHIKKYAQKQYQSSESLTAEFCVQSIGKYVERHGKNARGIIEQTRDLKKIAHYACLAYFAEENNEDGRCPCCGRGI